MSSAKLEKKLASLERKLKYQVADELDFRLQPLLERIAELELKTNGLIHSETTPAGMDECQVALPGVVEELKASSVVPSELATALRQSQVSVAKGARRRSILLTDDDEALLEPVPFMESVWTIGLFLGLAGATWADRVLSYLLFAANAVMQIAFTAIIISPDFLGSPFAAEKDMAIFWRRSVAHDHNKMDFDGMSLAARVCNGDSSLIYSTTQKTLVEQINAFLSLGANDFEAHGRIGVGGILQLLCCAYWLFYVLNYVRAVCTGWEAFLGIPRANVSELHRGVWISISWSRFIFFTFFCLLRLCMCCALLYAGIQWLTSTTSVPDLILNAVALGAVLDIDNLLFMAMVPIKIQVKVQDMEAIKVGYSQRRSTVEAVSIIMFVVVALLMAWGFYIVPLECDMLAVKAALCKGNQNFVVAENPDTQVTFLWESNKFGGVIRNQTMLEYAVEDAVNVSAFSESQYSVIKGLRSEFSVSFQESMQNYASSALRAVLCADWDDPEFPPEIVSEYDKNFRNVARRLGKPSARGCADLVSECDEKENKLLRSLCPKTCDCASVFKYDKLLLRVPVDGCPAACQVEAHQTASKRVCLDRNVVGPQWTTFWNGWMNDSLKNVGADSNGPAGEYIKKIVDVFQRYGCEALYQYPKDPFTEQPFCQGGRHYSALSWVCPGACACHVWNSYARDTLKCPTSCEPCEDRPIPEFFPSRSCAELRTMGFCMYPLGLELCKKTCGKCECHDAEEEDMPSVSPIRNCSMMASSGFCVSLTAQWYCPRTCDACYNGFDPSAPIKLTCRDLTSSELPGWMAQHGNCSTFGGEEFCVGAAADAYRYCPKSCGFCLPTNGSV